jgi:hypothetical protein
MLWGAVQRQSGFLRRCLGRRLGSRWGCGVRSEPGIETNRRDNLGPSLPKPRLNSGDMALSGDEFLRLESLIYRPVSARPDWIKQHLFCKSRFLEAGHLVSMFR